MPFLFLLRGFGEQEAGEPYYDPARDKIRIHKDRCRFGRTPARQIKLITHTPTHYVVKDSWPRGVCVRPPRSGVYGMGMDMHAGRG